MPLTGNPQTDISELTRRCKKGGFGNIRGKSFEQCRRSAIAASMEAKRRKGRKSARSRR